MSVGALPPVRAVATARCADGRAPPASRSSPRRSHARLLAKLSLLLLLGSLPALTEWLTNGSRGRGLATSLRFNVVCTQ